MNTEIVVGSWSSEPQQLNYSGVTDPASWLVEALGGGEADSGERVNHSTVLTSGPVYQAVTLISSALAMLPVEVFRVRRGDRSRAPDANHDIHKIFNTTGNDEMTPYIMRQTLIGWTLLHGNGIGVIERVGGRNVGVYPLQPGAVWAERLPDTEELRRAGLANEIIYRYTLDNGETGTLFRHEVFHLKLFGNGLWGHSPLTLFANLFGKGLAVGKFQGKTFANAARPSGVLQKEYGPGIPAKLTPDARANLRREWEDMHSGVDNTGKVAILTDGLKWIPLSVTNEQAQMIESLKYHREEVAAIYNLPPHKLGAMENSAVRANIEEQNRSYVEDSLMPIGTVFEQECRDKLCSPAEKRLETCEVKINYKQRLRADHKTRNEAYNTGRTGGWLSVNDIRELEDMQDIGDKGDIYLVPSNMADAETRQPFANAPSEREPDEEPDEDQESSRGAAQMRSQAYRLSGKMLAYARKQVTMRRSQEIKALRQGLARKGPFEQFCRKYYESLAAKLMESLEPITVVDGFVSPQALQTAIDVYVEQSRAIVGSAKTESELFDKIDELQQAANGFVDSLREC